MTVGQIVGEGLSERHGVSQVLHRYPHEFSGGQRHGLSYIFISHDLAVIRAMSHRVMVMKDGDVVEESETLALFEAPQHPYTRELLAAAHLA